MQEEILAAADNFVTDNSAVVEIHYWAAPVDTAAIAKIHCWVAPADRVVIVAIAAPVGGIPGEERNHQGVGHSAALLAIAQSSFLAWGRSFVLPTRQHC